MLCGRWNFGSHVTVIAERVPKWSHELLTVGIGLPRLDHGVGYRSPIRAQDAALHEHVVALALGRDRLPVLNCGMVSGEPRNGLSSGLRTHHPARLP